LKKVLNEKDLKEKGEELAKVAVEVGLGFRQLKTLYKLAKTKPVPFIEAFVKRQMARHVVGFDSFGPTVLELLVGCADDKPALQKILMYATMLHQYIESQAKMKLKEDIEPIVKRRVEGFGYSGIEISEKGGTEFKIKLVRFRGNPAILASEIASELRKEVPAVSKLRFRVWIERI
jgi:hypothetical protein